MVVVIEGPDATGKSTLATKISEHFGWRVISSEGPEKYAGEIIDRVMRYANNGNYVIYDRHPFVSQPIYSPGKVAGLFIDMAASFYTGNPYFIYCRLPELMELAHITKPHDTPEHLQMLDERGDEIKALYDEWALRHANMIYRIGTPLQPLLNAIAGAIR